MDSCSHFVGSFVNELDFQYLSKIIHYIFTNRKTQIMSFSSKLAVVIATGAVFAPLAASANPVVSGGSTAAAVSIKFQPCGKTSGNFSIVPGGTATGGGSGVQELSAAVATGETSADAKASSGKYGTTATASGYSAPVHFSYEATSLHQTAKGSFEATNHSQYEQEAALKFAANKKASSYYEEQNATAIVAGIEKKGHKYLKGDFVKGNSASEKSGSTHEASLKLDGKLAASATSKTAIHGSAENNIKQSRTTYTYTGSSAGLKYLPH
jgi:hypothetical protein